jgi:general secretion pathway protein G
MRGKANGSTSFAGVICYHRTDWLAASFRSGCMRYFRSSAPQAPARRPRDAGFTLIEIMVVVVIIGLLAAAIVPGVVGHVEEARLVRAKEDLRALGTALTMYRIDNFQYPTTDEGLKALVVRPADPAVKHWRPGGYIAAGSLKDPWGNDYQYIYPGTHGQPYDLFSYGPNGPSSAGSGEGSTVIGNWNLDASASGTSDSGGASP